MSDRTACRLSRDIITRIDGVAVEGSIDQTLARLRGPAGSSVRLSLVRDGEALELMIVRARIWQRAADLQVAVKDGKLLITATGNRAGARFRQGRTGCGGGHDGQRVLRRQRRPHASCVPARRGRPTMRLVLNPGPWQITGQRIN